MKAFRVLYRMCACLQLGGRQSSPVAHGCGPVLGNSAWRTATRMLNAEPEDNVSYCIYGIYFTVYRVLDHRSPVRYKNIYYIGYTVYAISYLKFSTVYVYMIFIL